MAPSHRLHMWCLPAAVLALVLEAVVLFRGCCRALQGEVAMRSRARWPCAPGRGGHALQGEVAMRSRVADGAGLSGAATRSGAGVGVSAAWGSVRRAPQRGVAPRTMRVMDARDACTPPSAHDARNARDQGISVHGLGAPLHC
jgi:hypothetical protein